MIINMEFLSSVKSNHMMNSDEIDLVFEKLDLKTEKQRKERLFEDFASSNTKYEVRITEDTVTSVARSEEQ